VVNQIPDQKTTRHDIQEQVLHAQGAADVIADETLRDEVAKAGIRLDPFKQVELPKKSVAEKKGATGEEATHISGLLAKALKAEVPHGTHTLQIAAFSVTEGAKIEEALKKWEHAGVAPWIREVALPQKGRWFRVYLGGYEGREAADHAGAEYKGQGKITSYVVGKIPGK
jgi:cell division septation protein DedD